ncbi:hypothetical protein H8S90_10920 [Olivibacter sp. SDN3]|uniref:ATP-grasp fold amidoligase family protein n=1 Tax=Olivibacter sp. SDN3 TaxID=2764720 RepID=UPI001651567C|nr:ATP-grasp fold amidoligase family protein [Olivibacter sp. SDN3]QNL52034.1 hypothetical protein H8S90_10920 [Olivibacter sp. SDN3]
MENNRLLQIPFKALDMPVKLNQAMLKYIKNYLGNSNDLTTKIMKRHRIFWEDPQAETVRNTRMSRLQPLATWKDVPNWQRKLSNKYNAREFAIKNDCKTADLYWKGSHVDQIDFESLPKHYVIRPTIGHNSNNVFIMKEGLNLFDNKYYTNEEIREYLKLTLSQQPAIEFLIEEFLQNETAEHQILTDYKFYCFNGHIASCHVINRLSPKSGFASFYDEHWNKMPTVHVGYPFKEWQEKPKCYEDMVSKVKQLSRAYEIFVRIDFYATAKGAVFGEFTPTPSLGNHFTSYGKRLLLQHWEAYCKGMI